MEELNEWREAGKAVGIKLGVIQERKRIIDLLTDLNAIRRDALGHLVAFNTDGTEIIYLDGLETE